MIYLYAYLVWGANRLNEPPGLSDGLNEVYLSVQGVSLKKSTNDGASVPCLSAVPKAPAYSLLILPYWLPQYCLCAGALVP